VLEKEKKIKKKKGAYRRYQQESFQNYGHYVPGGGMGKERACVSGRGGPPKPKGGKKRKGSKWKNQGKSQRVHQFGGAPNVQRDWELAGGRGREKELKTTKPRKT